MKHSAGKSTEDFFLFEHPDAFNNGWVKQTPAAPRSRPHCYQQVTGEWRNLSGLFWMWAHLNTFRFPPNFSSWLFRDGRATQVGLCRPCEVKHLQVNFDALTAFDVSRVNYIFLIIFFYFDNVCTDRLWWISFYFITFFFYFYSESIAGRNKKKFFSSSWVFPSFSQRDNAEWKATAATQLIYPFLQQNSSHWACQCKHMRTKMQRVWHRWVYFPACI